jgi:hypothetical protein
MKSQVPKMRGGTRHLLLVGTCATCLGLFIVFNNYFKRRLTTIELNLACHFVYKNGAVPSKRMDYIARFEIELCIIEKYPGRCNFKRVIFIYRPRLTWRSFLRQDFGNAICGSFFVKHDRSPSTGPGDPGPDFGTWDAMIREKQPQILRLAPLRYGRSG